MRKFSIRKLFSIKEVYYTLQQSLKNNEENFIEKKN